MNTEQIEMLRLSAQFPDEQKNATIRAVDLNQLLDHIKTLEEDNASLNEKIDYIETRLRNLTAATQTMKIEPPTLVTNDKKPG